MSKGTQRMLGTRPKSFFTGLLVGGVEEEDAMAVGVQSGGMLNCRVRAGMEGVE
jgi:hypothetical protein